MTLRAPLIAAIALAAAACDGSPPSPPVDGVVRTIQSNDPQSLTLIGNTDRHYGNISLVLVDDDWRLSPTYDMLPMLYMPIAGELVPQDLALDRKLPNAATLDVWAQARALARTFWDAVAHEARVSGDFRTLARDHAATLAALEARAAGG